MSISVSVIFTGLCALVASADQRPAPAQVLLVDAKAVGEVRGTALPEHAPTLVASLGTLANPGTSHPDRVVAAWPGRGSAAASPPSLGLGAPEQIGIWDLTRSEVRIKIQGGEAEGVRLYQPPRGTSPWPSAPRGIGALASWRDLRYVPDMRTLTGDGRIDPELVDADGASQTSLPPRIAARVRLDGGRLEAAVPSQKVFRDSLFEFRAAGAEPTVRQAVTDAVRWSLETEAAAVVIEIVPVDGGETRRLVLTPSRTPHDLFVSNLPAENVHGDMHSGLNEEDLAALHFGAYYALLLHPPAEGPVPRRWRSPAERRATGNLGTFLCPPARFSLP